MRGLIVGPSPGKGYGDPLSGRIGERLVELLGLSSESELNELFDRMNLISYDTKQYKDGYPHGVARQRADSLRVLLSPGRVVVLLGKEVQRAFRVQGDDVGVLVVPGSPTWVLLPHPSGLNRWYNLPENVDRAKRELQVAVRMVHAGPMPDSRNDIRGIGLGDPTLTYPDPTLEP